MPRRRLVLGLGVFLCVALVVIILSLMATIPDDGGFSVNVLNDTGIAVQLDRCTDLKCNELADRVVLMPGESTEENTLPGGYDPFIVKAAGGKARCVALALPRREPDRVVSISEMRPCSGQ